MKKWDWTEEWNIFWLLAINNEFNFFSLKWIHLVMILDYLDACFFNNHYKQRLHFKSFLSVEYVIFRLLLPQIVLPWYVKIMRSLLLHWLEPNKKITLDMFHSSQRHSLEFSINICRYERNFSHSKNRRSEFFYFKNKWKGYDKIKMRSLKRMPVCWSLNLLSMESALLW